jgi:hypothetical protein
MDSGSVAAAWPSAATVGQRSLRHATETPPQEAAPRPALRLIAILTLLIGLIVGSLPALAQGARNLEYPAKAVMLYRFLERITWPDEGPAGGDRPLTIGWLGESPLPAAFGALEGKTIKGRPLRVKALSSAQQLEDCQVVFVSASARGRSAELLPPPNKPGVLTVGESEGFAERGGILNFFEERNRVRFEINLQAAQQCGLNISGEILKLARLVKS